MSQYVYYEAGDEPTKEDIEASETLEGRLREGFVRLRQLLVSGQATCFSLLGFFQLTPAKGLTRHEIRLRAPFDPLPYSALIDSCEQFFEYVVALRQSSLFYHPHFISDNSDAALELLGHRRDAVATILTNLYVLSGALRSNRMVPVCLHIFMILSFATRVLIHLVRNTCRALPPPGSGCWIGRESSRTS